MKTISIFKSSIISLVVSVNLYANDTTTNKKLDEVTVTANKIEENLQYVPQSISVIDGEILQEKGITDIMGIVKEIPNMSDIPDHGTMINFRGLNSSMFTNNNPVVIYIDGVPTSDRMGYDVSLSNVERVEVLRGPQGTLYGKDAIGAVINIITKEPTNTLSGNLGFEYSSNNTMLGTFNINGPIIEDKLYFGLNGKSKNSDGWVTNSLKNDDKANNSTDNKYSGYLLFKPSDNLSAKLTLSKYDVKKDWGANHTLPGASLINEFNRKGAEVSSFDVDAFENTKVDSQSLNINYDLNGLNFSSVTTHKKLDLDSDFDSDYGNNPMFAGLKQFNYTENEEWTQELRLSSFENEIKWVTGLYFDKGDRSQGPYGMEYPMYDPITFAFLGNYSSDAYSKSKSTTQALFGQAIIPITQKIDLTLGGRYQRIKKDIDLKMYNNLIGANQMLMQSLNGKKNWSAFLPKVAFSYKMNDTLTSFASVSKGYMPGGFNYFSMTGNQDENSFKPQTSVNYEVGVKTVFDDLVLNASIFRMDIKDIHIYKQENGMFLTDNADKAHSYGLEVDFNYFPTDEIEISGAVGLIKAKYDDYNAGSKKYDGEKIENTPSYTANLGIAYYHPTGYYGRLDTKAIGPNSFFNSGFQKFESQGSSFFADVKVGYKYKDFDIYSFVTNLTNEEYMTSYKNNGMVGIATFNDPRAFGLGLKYSF